MNTQQEYFEKYVDDIVHVNYTDWDSIFTLSNAIYHFKNFLESNIEDVASHSISKDREISKLVESIAKLEYYKKDKQSDLKKMLIVKAEVLNHVKEIRTLLEKATSIRYKTIQE